MMERIHVPGSVRSGNFPWGTLQEHAHVGVLTDAIEQSIDMMSDGIKHGVECGFNLICLIDEKHGRMLRDLLDKQSVDHVKAVANGRLRWVDSASRLLLKESVKAAFSMRPEAGAPLILVLPIWSEAHRTPASMRDAEATLHRLAVTGKARIVCFHPISYHRQAVLLSAIDAHSQIWFERRLTDNAFYVPIPSRKSRRRVAELLCQRFIMLRQSSAKMEIRGMDRETAHELNNLLAAIVGNTDILQLALSPNAPAHEQLHIIYNAARQAAEICRRLPVAASQQEAARKPAGAGQSSPSPKPVIPGRLSDAWRGWGRLLLVDDEDAIRVVGKHILERLGFTVLTACDGYEALEIYRNTAGGFRAVILDLLMPRLTGQETFKELRQLKSDLPILIASGLGTEEIRQRFPDDRFMMTLPKPFGIVELTQALKNLLSEEKASAAAAG